MAVGKRFSELLGATNSHLMKPVTEVSTSKPTASLLKTQIQIAQGTSDANKPKGLTVPINFHVTKLHDADKKLHSFCLVLQPIVRAKAGGD